MEFREKPMQNLIRIKEKEICKNVQALLLFLQNIFPFWICLSHLAL